MKLIVAGIIFLIIGSVIVLESSARFPVGYANPRDQYLINGIQPWELNCPNPNFKLIFKDSNNLPACVTYETFEKLIQRGWAKTNVDYDWEFDKTKQFENSTSSINYKTLRPQTLEQIKTTLDSLILNVNAISQYSGPLSIFIPQEIFDLRCVTVSSNYFTNSTYMLENYQDDERIKVRKIATESSNQILEFQYVWGKHEVTIKKSSECEEILTDFQPILPKK